MSAAEPVAHMEPEAELGALVALASLPGVGPVTLAACRQQGGAARAWEALRAGRGATVPALEAAAKRMRGDGAMGRLEAAAARLEPAAVLARHRAAGIDVLVHGAAGYPQRLTNDLDPPPLLFVQGSLDALAGPTVAIVGTRNATRLGCDTAANLAEGLAACGVTIVSGLALGVDGAAHQAVVALDAPVEGHGAIGTAVGVVAAGFDRPYPRRHQVLHQQVAQRGALLAEVPLGGQPLPWRFPARNRIIAALADAVVVVESRSKGGSMLTAAEALKRGTSVMAVPGHPNSAQAAGALDLIFDGAPPVRCVDDVLVGIGLGGRTPVEGLHGMTDAVQGVLPLDGPERLVLDALAEAPCTLGSILHATGLDLDEASGVLLGLERDGRISRSGPWFERVASAPRARRRHSGGR